MGVPGGGQGVTDGSDGRVLTQEREVKPAAIARATYFRIRLPDGSAGGHGAWISHQIEANPHILRPWRAGIIKVVSIVTVAAVVAATAIVVVAAAVPILDSPLRFLESVDQRKRQTADANLEEHPN